MFFFSFFFPSGCGGDCGEALGLHCVERREHSRSRCLRSREKARLLLQKVKLFLCFDFHSETPLVDDVRALECSCVIGLC